MSDYNVIRFHRDEEGNIEDVEHTNVVVSLQDNPKGEPQVEDLLDMLTPHHLSPVHVMWLDEDECWLVQYCGTAGEIIETDMGLVPLEPETAWFCGNCHRNVTDDISDTEYGPDNELCSFCGCYLDISAFNKADLA